MVGQALAGDAGLALDVDDVAAVRGGVGGRDREVRVGFFGSVASAGSVGSGVISSPVSPPAPLPLPPGPPGPANDPLAVALSSGRFLSASCWSVSPEISPSSWV